MIRHYVRIVCFASVICATYQLLQYILTHSYLICHCFSLVLVLKGVLNER